MLKPNFLTTVALSLLALTSGGMRAAQGQATVNGAAVISNGVSFMTLSGQISTPTGFTFSGPTIISSYSNPVTFDPPNPLFPTTLRVLNIEPGLVEPDPNPVLDPAAVIAQQLSIALLDPNTQLAEVITLIRAGEGLPENITQATASGTVTYSDGINFVQTLTGDVSLQTGYFAGPLIIEQSPGVTGSPNVAAYPINNTPGSGEDPYPNPPDPLGLGLISSLVISPGSPQGSFGIIPFFPNTLNAAVAQQLRNATDLDTKVSILRAGQYLFGSAGQNQSRAVATASLFDFATGFNQTVSGEISLPNGLYFIGPDVETYTGSTFGIPPERFGVCTPGSSCLFVASVFEDATVSPFAGSDPAPPYFKQLIIDPGPIAAISPALDFNAEAAVQLITLVDLSDVVSFIRAGTTADGPLNSSLQATASGSVTIGTPNFSGGGVILPPGLYFASQSVAGEVTLPPGLYFEHQEDGVCKNPSGGIGSGCLAIQSDIQQLFPGNFDLDSVAINNLTLYPGAPLPGTPTPPVPVPVSIPIQDFNAQAALKVYDAVGGDLADLVSLIRAGSEGGASSGGNLVQARATGAVTTVFATGASQTISGEINLPAGQFFDGSLDPACSTLSTGQCFLFLPTYSLPLDGTIASFTVDPGPGNNTVEQWTFSGAKAYAITQQVDVSDTVSVIRAATGAQGLE